MPEKEVTPLWDGLTPTGKRWGVHRNTVLKIVATGEVDTRRLGVKILVRQIGPRSMESYYENRLPPGTRAAQTENLRKGTELSHAGQLKRKRHLKARKSA
jgi:hypothetical protein